MHQHQVDLVVIGGGPAGMAAAITAHQAGIDKILLIERASRLGGVLPQCIHTGFGLKYLKEELTGPEYAESLAERVATTSIETLLDTTVTSIATDRTILARNDKGMHSIASKAVILAMGCRERTRGSILLPGTRPAGVFTAGTAQYLVNLRGHLPGHRAVVLGSGDIGLIMARRLTIEGCDVVGVYEINNTPSGLPRNITQCLEDFNIPIHLGTTITTVHGVDRVTGVTVAKVDAALQPIEASAEFVACDTIILSVGLIPENELSKQIGIRLNPRTGGPVVDQNRQTSQLGFFACGNVSHVHDLADEASQEGELAGRSAARFALGCYHPTKTVTISADEGIRYVVPQRLSLPGSKDVILTGRLSSRASARSSIVLATSTGHELLRRPLSLLRPGSSWRVKLPEIDTTEDLSLSVCQTGDV